MKIYFLRHELRPLNDSTFLTELFYIGKKNSKTSLKDLLKLGAKTINNTSFETAYVKISLAYGSLKEEKKISKFLNNNNFFEKVKF